MTVNSRPQSGPAGSSQSVFKKEFEAFCAQIENNPKQKKKLAFFNRIKDITGTTSPEIIEDELGKLVKNAKDKKLRRAYSHIHQAMEAIKDYTGVIEVMIQAYPFPTALIWGGLKIVFECAGRYHKQFELIRAEVQQLPDVIWELSSFEDLYGTCLYGADVVQRVLSSSYQTLFKFWYRCTKILESPVAHVFTTNTKLQVLLDDLKSNSAYLTRIRDGIEAHLGKDLRESISAEQVHAAAERVAAAEERQRAESEREKAEAARKLAEEEWRKAEEERKKAQRERELMEEERRKAEAERQKAEAHRFADIEAQNERVWDSMGRRHASSEDDVLNYGVYEQGIKNRHAGTCNWLFETVEFQKWIHECSKKSVFWLSGKHGAGKSFLCSSAIRHIKDLNRGKSYGGVFRFLTKDFYVTRNQILRHMASELLQALFSMTLSPKEVPDSLVHFIQMNMNDSSEVENLIRTTISELPITYIFIDGLDEAEYADDDSRPAQARGDDVQAIVEFLIRDIASPSPHKLKLWISSQPLPQIRDYICRAEWAKSVQELSLQTWHTEKDILSYLGSAIATPNADNSFGRLFVTASLASEVEGSFLWANTMLNDLKSEADDDSELFKLAREGLPTKMNQVYNKVIHRLQKKQNWRSDNLPLWKIVLSLITFAKRPLKMGEVIDAVAMTRTDDCHNLNTNKITTPDKILSSCMSLVRLQETPGQWGNDHLLNSVLRFSHSAVRTFLIKNSDTERLKLKDAEPFVTSQIIKRCCLRYWMQPRYRYPLERTAVGFQTYSGESLEGHRLLTYAAKYWYQHFDSHSSSDSDSFALTRSPSELKGPQDIDRAQVKEFLRASNFQTCLQVQCLFVVQHFMQRFDKITDEAKAVRRTLPNWVPRVEPQIHRQYAEFQSEWCHLLVPGRGEIGGELDRCFWSALGPENFLSRNIGRYRSFQIQPRVAEGGSESNSLCRFMKISPDGKVLVICSIEERSESDAVLNLQKWMQDGDNRFSHAGSGVSIPFTLSDANLERYWVPSTESFRSVPLVPNINCVIPPTALSLSLDSNNHSSTVRIGSQLFHLSSPEAAGPSPSPSRIDDEALGGSWEDVVTRGPYLVVCRRRVPRPQPPAAEEEREKKRVQAMKNRMSQRDRKRDLRRRRPGRRVVEVPPSGSLRTLKKLLGDQISDSSDSSSSRSKSSDSPDSSNSSDSLSGHPSPDSSDSDDELLDIPSAEESWSEGSEPSEQGDSSDDSIRSYAPSDDGDELDLRSLESDKDEKPDKDESGSDLESHPETDDSDGSFTSLVSLSHVTGGALLESGSESELPDSDFEDDDGIFDQVTTLPGTFDHEKGIVLNRGGNIECDGCGVGSLRKWYHCIKCNDGDFDLCHQCERRGRWCLNQGHQLYRMVKRKVVGVMTRRNFGIRQEIKVYENGSEDSKKGKVLFHLRKNYTSLLYQSPPIIHPQHQLVVWPLTGKILLFADVKANKFFEQKIKSSGTRKAREICVNLSFSPCGQHLRVATIEAEVSSWRLPTTQSSPRQQPRNSPCICLNLHVMVMRLSPSNPARKPPKLLHSTNLRIGPCSNPIVQQLPFTFTWCPTGAELFVTLSDLRLRVYRVTLPTAARAPAPEKEEGNPVISITTLQNKIYLPRSSRHRSVHYFPPRTLGGDSTVIIGPRYGRFPAPPICVSLSDEDIGGWVAANGPGSGSGQICAPPHMQPQPPRQALEGQLEHFIAEQDCDIIPF